MKSSTFDLSPIKGSNAVPAIPPSSSPAPVRRSPATSPSRNGISAKPEASSVEDIEEEDEGFDLTRYFHSQPYVNAH